jgi:hypothetical protein
VAENTTVSFWATPEKAANTQHINTNVLRIRMVCQLLRKNNKKRPIEINRPLFCRFGSVGLSYHGSRIIV